MIDVNKQVAFWRDSSLEDWDVARDLVKKGRTRHGLFFAHLTLEKLLKALVVRRTNDLAPRIHNLVRLAQLADAELIEAQVDTLAEMNAFNLEGRYPEFLTPPPDKAEAKVYMKKAEEIRTWLMSLLS